MITLPTLQRWKSGLSTVKRFGNGHINDLHKLQPVTPVTYKLDLLCHCSLANSLHVSQFKVIKAGLLDTESPLTMPQPPLEIDGQPAYSVKQLQ